MVLIRDESAVRIRSSVAEELPCVPNLTNHVEVEVCDDGCEPHIPKTDSQGLRIMQERADSIGAKLVIDPPGPDSPGTCVHVYLDATSR